MNDEQIIALYFQRDEDAIRQTDTMYGKLCLTIANHILNQMEDSKECVNDTYNHAWNDIPPTYPRKLKAYLVKITRNIAINMLEKRTAIKRGGMQIDIALEELGECIPSCLYDPIDALHQNELVKVIQAFIEVLPENERNIFISRYFFIEDNKEIAKKYNMKKSNVFNILLRTRKKLYDYLQKEGYEL